MPALAASSRCDALARRAQEKPDSMRERVGEHAAKSLRAAVVAACAAIGLAVVAGGLAGLPSLAQTNATVKVASAGIASDIGFFIADKKGYFRAEGLDVQLSTLANSPQMIGPLG